MSEWIRCEVVMPEVGQRVLCSGRPGIVIGLVGTRQERGQAPEVRIYYWPESSGNDCYHTDADATHWMPLPAPPTK